MSKGQFIFEEYETSSGIYVITLNNFRYHNYFSENVQRILKRFLTDDKLFFGFYRTDGLNISNKCQEVIKNEIPLFFRKNGCINYLNEYLSTAEIIATDRVFDYIPFIFDYFLETIIFKPNISIENFNKCHSDYMNNRVEELILKKYTDMLFYYFDSGDFSIYFDPKKYEPAKVRDVINSVLSN